MSSKLRVFLEYILLFIIVLIFNFYSIGITHVDEIWMFGFPFNISSGLIAYRDFNMVIGPVYPTIIGLFMYCFGNNMFVFYVVHSLMIVFIYYLMKKICHNDLCIIVVVLLCIFLFPSYNLLLLLLLLLILYMEKRNFSDYIIGFFLSVICFTKINVGLFMLIPSFLSYYNDIYKLLRRLFSFLLFAFIMLLIFFYNNSLIQFINYTIIGLFDFATNNFYISFFIVLWFVCLFFLIIEIIKKRNNSFLEFYLLFFLIIAYPIFDFYHVFIAVVPTGVYLFSKLKIKSIHLKIFAFAILILFLFFNLININSLNLKKIPNSVFFKYKYVNDDFIDNYNYVKSILNNTYDYDKVFLFSSFAYAYKIENNISIDRFDLINNGNMGFDGENRYISFIDDYCENKKCVFLVSRQEYETNLYSQLNKKIIGYVINNYNLRDSVSNSSDWFEVYDNTKMCMFEK